MTKNGPGAEINCLCGKSGITIADGTAKLKFQCGCQDCRQALEYGFSKGGKRPNPLPELLYMSSDITAIRGKEFMTALQLREEENEDDSELLGMSRRIYCSECFSIIGVDHPAYENNVFLTFPEHCDNLGDLSVPLTTYVMMIDYTKDIVPMPTDDVPLFTTLRFEQEEDRLFNIPEVDSAFSPREAPLEGITFSKLIEELGGASILNLEEGQRF